MRILFISMPSVHVIRWIENLKDTSFELFWYDILNRGKLETTESVIQFSGLNKRKLPYIKGEYFLSKKMPGLYQFIRPVLEVTEKEALFTIIKKINPDVIHSFEMQSCSYPIVDVKHRFPHIKWLYSCWGNDLYYYQNFKKHNSKIKKVLKQVDYLHTDCERDYALAQELGFKGRHVGVIPGGSGYKVTELAAYKVPINERNIILIKGYQHIFGRSLNVIKAIENLHDKLRSYNIVVFGAHPLVIDYINDKKMDCTVYTRHGLSQRNLMKLMGKSLIYIGNNISDGMPNTLLEAIVMGAFPIQSNPGNATAEIIQDDVNGLLIQNPESITSIQDNILKALTSPILIKNAYEINAKLAEEKLDYEINRKKIISIYNSIEYEGRL